MRRWNSLPRCPRSLASPLLLLLALVVPPSARGGVPAAQSSAAPAQARPAPEPDRAAIERRLLEAARRSPDSFEAHQTLAGFYLQQGEVAEAIPHLRRAHAIDPAHYANGYDLAAALLQTGQVDDARQQVKRMLAIQDTGELHNLLGDIEEHGGNLIAAAEAYQRAAHMDATEEHLFDWGNNLLQLPASDVAQQVFVAAIARYPKSARLHVGLGIAEYSLGNYKDAVNALCSAVDLDPSDPRAYQFLGEMYGVAPELADEVTGRLERFVKTQPRNALAHLHYGLSLWKGRRSTSDSSNLRQVEALLRRAVTLDPRLAGGFLQLGILLSDQRRYLEAIKELRHATRLQPELAQAHYRLAQAYLRTGQKALAAKELEIFEQLKAKSQDQSDSAGP